MGRIFLYCPNSALTYLRVWTLESLEDNVLYMSHFEPSPITQPSFTTFEMLTFLGGLEIFALMCLSSEASCDSPIYAILLQIGLREVELPNEKYQKVWIG